MQLEKEQINLLLQVNINRWKLLKIGTVCDKLKNNARFNIARYSILEGEKIMGFLSGLLYYACLFVALVAVATAGVLVGKKLRDRKDAKKSKEIESETTIN